jgi:peptidoglycan/LPS O-acetylase OafA/YrhL
MYRQKMRPTSLDSILRRDQNNFDLIRVLAAMFVIFGHSFVLHPTAGWREPVGLVFEFTYSGALAVDVFFFLSGILIASSFCQARSLTRFVLMRVARIWPGLTVCILISSLVVGPLVTTMSAADYLSSWQTWSYMFANIKLQKIDYVLPGVFESNHYRQAVNGSLWTLPIEIRCYLMLLLLGVVGGLRRPRWSIALGIALAVLAVTVPYSFRAFKASDESAARMPLIFSLGMLCYMNRQLIVIDWRVSVAAAAAAIVLKSTLFGVAAFYLFILNTVMVLGATPILRGIKLPGDYSYGIYIYGFVVQQCVAHYLPAITSYPSLLLSLPMSALLAVLSWHYVEGPFLGLARVASKRYEVWRGMRS